MTNLSVNLNVAALLRNRRNHPWPDVVGLGRCALNAGAFGLTVHPRPDQRHIRPSDVRNLKTMLDSEFPDRELNVEGFPDAAFLTLAEEVRADQVTLVPDGRDQPTSDHGWDFAADRDELTRLVALLQNNGHRVALFADANARQVPDAATTGTDRIELYTGPFGSSYDDPDRRETEITLIESATSAALQHGLALNAGHDLTVAGTKALLARIPVIAEVPIGHALFCDALTHGIRDTVKRYAAACKNSRRCLRECGNHRD